MIDDSAQIEKLRRAADRLSSPGERGMRHHRDDLLVIADAAADLSGEGRRLFPSSPWIVLIEMGRGIRRAGDDVDPRSVAATLERDIPELLAHLRVR